MTVSSEDKRTAYTGTGSTGPFSIGFRILEAEHIRVTRRVTATGATTQLTLNAGSDGFTIDDDLTEITLTEALSNGTETLTIERDVPLTQLIDYIANSAFPAEINERGLDQLTMICQQLDDASDRALKFDSTLSTSLTGVITQAPVDGQFLVWSGTTGNMVNVAVADIETSLDAVFTSTATNDLIVYDGTNWINTKTLAGDLTFSGDLTLSGDNTYSGTASFTSTATFSGAATFESSASFDTTATFTGEATFNANINVTNVDANGSGGGILRTSGGTNCLSWGGGGAANLTLGGNMSGGSTHKLVNMADPTSEQDYATKNYVDTELASAGGLELLGSYTASGVTSVDIGDGLDLDAVIDDTYDTYVLNIVDLVPATDSTALRIRTSSNTGSSFDSGASDYNCRVASLFSSAGGHFDDGGVSLSHIRTMRESSTNPIGNASGEGLSGFIYIKSPAGSLNKFIRTEFDYVNAAGAYVSTTGGGTRKSTTAIDAIQLYMSAGNITSGTFYLYGIKKS